jgi:hypothetical protein
VANPELEYCSGQYTPDIGPSLSSWQYFKVIHHLLLLPGQCKFWPGLGKFKHQVAYLNGELIQEQKIPISWLDKLGFRAGFSYTWGYVPKSDLMNLTK